MQYPWEEYLQTLTPISDFEVITPNHQLIDYQNDENSFANPTHYINVLQNHCKTVQNCENMFRTFVEFIIYQH